MSKQQATSTGVLSYAASAGSSISSYLSPLIPGSIKSSSSSPSSGSELPASSRDMDRFYHVRVRPLLDAVDQLRSLLQSEPIKLPTIVVVGDQSSGKSSVLEALSGVSLPRGQNITTRCPLVLRLINLTPDNAASNGHPAATTASSSSSSSAAPSAVAQPVRDGHTSREKTTLEDSPISSSSLSGTDGAAPRPYAYLSLTPLPAAKDVRITNLEDIGPRITALTSQLAGHNAGISSTPLYLSVYRAASPELTLVDLPGLTRNPIGDQPKDIYAQIRRMIEKYIAPVESVILNVMPASVDMPTCECVMLSKQVDPEGLRSIGVVTKMDLAERGVRRKLEKGVEELGLQLGVVAVRCRSQEEIDRGVSWEVSREMERSFFRQHPELSALADTSEGSLSLGIPALAALLTTIQEHKIRSSLPDIRIRIREQLSSQRALLAALPPTLATYTECRMRCDHLLSQYVSAVSALARGDHSAARGDNKLHLSPRLSELYGLYASTLSANSSQYLTLEYARAVQEEIRENSGVTLPNFLSHQVFEGLMRREIRKAERPSQELVQGVRQLLSSVLGQLMRDVFVGYGGLGVKLLSMTNGFLDEQQRIITARVDELLGQEEELYTQNTYYLDTVQKVKSQLYDRLYGGSAKDKEDRERAQERKERERGSDGRSSQGGASSGARQGGWLSSVVSSAVAVPTQLVSSSSNGVTSSLVTFPVNDLSVTVDLNALTLPLSAAASALSAPAVTSSSSALANLLPSNQILDMQINTYAYSVVAQKRLCDALPLILRFHFVRGVVAALGQRLQREVSEMGEKTLLDYMREDRDISSRRERLQTSVDRLDRALKLLDSL